jgi:hypothetical protein
MTACLASSATTAVLAVPGCNPHTSSSYRKSGSHSYGRCTCPCWLPAVISCPYPSASFLPLLPFLHCCHPPVFAISLPCPGVMCGVPVLSLVDSPFISLLFGPLTFVGLVPQLLVNVLTSCTAQFRTRCSVAALGYASSCTRCPRG